MIFRIWSFLKTKEGLMSLIITLLIIIPTILFIFINTKNLIYNVLGIKSDSEIKSEQKAVIATMSNENKELQHVIKIKDSIKNIEENITIKQIKEEKQIDKSFIELKNKVDKPIPKKIKKEVKILDNKIKPKKIIDKKIEKEVPDKSTIIINKKKYKEEGLKNINLIYDAFDLAKDVK
jgi:hypothetical protein